MIKKIFNDLIYIFGEYPIYILMGMGLIYSIIELVETRSFMKVFSANSLYQSTKSIFFTLIFLSVIGAFVYRSIFVEINKFKRTARTLNLNYRLKNHPTADKLLYAPVLKRGERRSIVSPILSGRYKDAQVIVFNYRYGRTESAGESYGFYFRSVVAFSVKGHQVPTFSLHPVQLGDRLFEKIFGGDDVKFEEDAEFSRRYKVSGPDSIVLRTFFGPNLRRAFIQSPTKWAAGVTGDHFIIFRDSKADDRVDSEGFAPYLNEVYMIYQTVLPIGKTKR
ncbi:MAG: hypothetical protein SWH54_02905 [Thermodesulfobacteriota bacterium]|nr:hypothetical protein [Thermodesulfobacteriota bacterium]